MNSVFGGNLNNVVSRLGTSTGLSTSSITKMLGLIAPVFMGVIGSKVKNEKLSTSGLMNFLSQQKNALTGFAVQTAESDYASLTGKKENEFKHLTQEVPWKKIALAALVLLGLWFWWLGAHQKVVAPIVVTTPPVQTVATPSVDELSAFMAAGVETNLPKHFRFEKLTFATGTTAVAPGSELELNKIANVMKQYPNSKARLEGFTDNVGSAQANRTLSAKRANAVKDQLIARGIEENRIQTVGLGEENPIGNNATAKGRAMNRRIEFVITNIK